MDIKQIIDKMSVEQLCGQLLCFDTSERKSFEKMKETLKRTHAGGVFVVKSTVNEIPDFKKLIEETTGIPALIAADVEVGPDLIDGFEKGPHSMALGASDDAETVERMHRATAAICRRAGINWTYSPVVDININPDNPVTNIRAISDSAEQVIKIAGAQIRGFQKNGLVMATAKHFPGDGTDDRNQHFCTTVNRLTAEEWMQTFGKVYKKLFEEGVSCVMVGHICLPPFQDAEEFDEYLGYRPGTLSHSLQTKLLREKLGFKGCIVSDAMSMIGACAAVPIDRLAVEFIKAGGDMILFPLPEDYDRLLAGVKSGEISMERLRNAVTHVLELKNRARLFEDEEKVLASVDEEIDVQKEMDIIGEKCIKIIRNGEGLLPLKLNKGARLLLVRIMSQTDKGDLNVLEDELKKRGYEVKTLTNPDHNDIDANIKDVDAVLVNCKLSSHSYPGGSLRVGWSHIGTFWRGYVFRHPKVIFTSFGDPYKLYDYPFLKTYINAHTDAPSAQRGFVKVLLGEVPETAKSPVALKGFFERNV